MSNFELNINAEKIELVYKDNDNSSFFELQDELFELLTAVPFAFPIVTLMHLRASSANTNRVISLRSKFVFGYKKYTLEVVLGVILEEGRDNSFTARTESSSTYAVR